MNEPPLRDPFNLVGETLDGMFRVDQVIGEGGFGIVYRGTRVDLDQPVAIKVLKVLDAFEPRVQSALLAKFKEEAHLLDILSRESPRIVRSLGFRATVTPGGMWAPYVALEWLEGVSLDTDLMQRRAEGLRGRSVWEAIDLLAPLAEGLGVAHDRNVAHRDVKPGNVFLTPKGLKVLDFGIAKVMSEGADANAPAATKSPFSAFTWMYGAPEQMDPSHGPTGLWTDVYSFAMILTEVLTDQAPLVSTDALAVMVEATHPTVRPTPRTRGASVSDEVERVCAQALTLQPKNRYPNVREFWTAFTQAVKASTSGAAHGGTRPLPSVPNPSRPSHTAPMPSRPAAQMQQSSTHVMPSSPPRAPTPTPPPAPVYYAPPVHAVGPDAHSLPRPPGHPGHPGHPAIGPRNPTSSNLLPWLIGIAVVGFFFLILSGIAFFALR